MIYLYDARFNITTKTTYEELENMGIGSRANLSSVKTKMRKLGVINKYILGENISRAIRRELYAKEEYKDEVWRDVLEYDDMYRVSNYGRVKKVGKTKEWLLLPYHKKNKIHLKLKVNGKPKETTVSKVVAKYFLDKPQFIGDDTDIVVKHLNGLYYDNRAENLEYITRSEAGKITGGASRSEAVYMVNANDYEILGTYSSHCEAARDNNVSKQAVSDITNYICSKSDGDVAFLREEDYESFIDTLEYKEYLIFDSYKQVSVVDTIYNYSKSNNVDMHSLRYSYISKKNIPRQNIYVYDKDFTLTIKDKRRLYENSFYWKKSVGTEIFSPIKLEDIKDCFISNYGRIKNEKGRLVTPTTKNSIKFITLNGNEYNVAKLLLSNSAKCNYSYEELSKMEVIFLDGDIGNISSNNLSAIHDKSELEIPTDKKNEPIYKVKVKKKIRLEKFNNINELSDILGYKEGYIYHSINSRIRIGNYVHMFESDCKNFQDI